MKLQQPIKFYPPDAPPIITQFFGEHKADYSRFHIIGHDGLDYAYPLDTPVYASHDGYLVYANATNRDYGLGLRQYFEEDGIGYELVYWHFDKIEFPDLAYDQLSQVTKIKQGDLIGYVDTTGYSTGNHLHLGLRLFKDHKLIYPDNGYLGSVDPLPYLKGNSMQLIKDNGTVYLVSGVNEKRKVGIADEVTLQTLFGDEPITDGDTSSVPETQTLSQGIISNKKG